MSGRRGSSGTAARPPEEETDDGLSLVLEYEKGGASGSSCGPCRIRNRNAAAPVNGQAKKKAQMSKAEEPVGVLVKCARKRKFTAVSTGVNNKGSQFVKTRPGTCKQPRLQASKRLVAESDSQVQNNKTPDETWLKLLNSLKKDGNQLRDISTGVKKKQSQHVKTIAFQPRGTYKPDVQAGKLLVAEFARLQNSQVQSDVMLDAEQNNQSSSDSNVMILDFKPSKSDTPLVVLDDDDGEEVRNFCSRNSCPQLK